MMKICIALHCMLHFRINELNKNYNAMYDFVARNALSKVFRVLARRLGGGVTKGRESFSTRPLHWVYQIGPGNYEFVLSNFFNGRMILGQISANLAAQNQNNFYSAQPQFCTIRTP